MVIKSNVFTSCLSGLITSEMLAKLLIGWEQGNWISDGAESVWVRKNVHCLMLNLMSVLNEALLFTVKIYNISWGTDGQWIMKILEWSRSFSFSFSPKRLFLHPPFGLEPATRESSSSVAVQNGNWIFTLACRRLGNDVKQRLRYS